MCCVEWFFFSPIPLPPKKIYTGKENTKTKNKKRQKSCVFE